MRRFVGTMTGMSPNPPPDSGTSGPETPAPPPPPPGAPSPPDDPPPVWSNLRDLRQLRRSGTDRRLAGVCGGLGRFLDVDPLIFRVLFLVFSPFGGLLLYGVLWLLLPDDGQETSEGQHLVQGRTSNQAIWAICAAICGFVLFLAIAVGRWDVAIWFLVIGLVVYLLTRDRDGGRGWRAANSAGTPPGTAAQPPLVDLPLGSPPQPAYAPWQHAPSQPPTPPAADRKQRSILPWLTISVALLAAGVLTGLDASDLNSIAARVVLATVLVIIGAGLLVGTWFGRARSLISIGLIVALVLFTVASLRVPLRGGIGDPRYEPHTIAEAERAHRLAIGKLTIDLRRLDLAGQTVRVNSRTAIGQTVICLPAGVPAVARTDIGVGGVSIHIPNAREDGDRVIVEPPAPLPQGGTLELEVTHGIGEILFTEGRDCEPS